MPPMSRRLKTASFELEGGRHLSQAVEEARRSWPFPAELFFMIFGYLGKKDCKAVRLVSTTWSAVATARLFDAVHFALRENEIDRFVKVTEHSVISKSITRFDYDMSRFIPYISEEDYVPSLLVQIEPLLESPPENVSFDGHNDDTRTLIELARQALQNGYLKQLLKKSPIVAAGFWKHTKLAGQQEVLL